MALKMEKLVNDTVQLLRYVVASDSTQSYHMIRQSQAEISSNLCTQSGQQTWCQFDLFRIPRLG